MPDFELQPGQEFGPYTVESTLGVGGMGRVFKATGPDGTVALKLVKEDIARDATFRKRFEREASIAQRVVHEHLVPVLDTGEVQGIPWTSPVSSTGTRCSWTTRWAMLASRSKRFRKV